MPEARRIEIDRLSRVEGHGGVRIEIREGQLVSARWQVVETPRFFEAMLLGKSWEAAPWLCSRICGICSIGHTLASIRAIENAFGVEPSEQTRKLRLLLKHLETLQSHSLHLFFLVMPDYLHAGSVFPLLESHPQVVKMAARIKQVANDGCDIVGGRRLHPTRPVVGGFTMLPETGELRGLAARLREVLEDIGAAVDLFRSFAVPDFERETEFVSLRGQGGYPFIGGDLVSSDGVVGKERDYRAMTNEYRVEGSTAKWARLSRESFAVGALARLNNNGAYLHPRARDAAETLGFRAVCHNPFMNTAAQLAECMHVVLDSLNLIADLMDTGWDEPRRPVTPREGRGVAAVEVPRGVLYHCYEFGADGKIIMADCVIPTGQNHGNIQHDLEALVKQKAAAGAADPEIRRLSEMLVRAYDPCISCSVH